MTKSASGLRLARRQFALLELVGQGIADRRGSRSPWWHRLPVVGYVKHLARLVGIEAGHLMHVKPVGDGLETELRARAADIVKCDEVGLTLFILDLRDRHRQHWRVFRPALIELHHRAQNLVEIFFVVASCRRYTPMVACCCSMAPSAPLRRGSLRSQATRAYR